MTMQQWFDAYGESHQNPTNKTIHWICVPLIFFSLIGLLSLVPVPFITQNVDAGFRPYLHIGTLVILLGLVFFIRLSFSITVGMLLVSSLVLYGIKVVNLAFTEYALWIYVFIFLVAWVGQFYGHRIEGKKPSFLKDLQFLMIGPAWLLHFIYRKAGIRY